MAQVNTDIETLGSCIHSFSIVGPLNTPTGVEVIPGALAALAFANPNGSSAPAVHLLSGSIARGIADPSSTTAVDYDGDSRPNPAGSRADIGADEVP